MIGHVIREFLPRAEILNYLDAILRVYNRFGRRDNKYKARIKILVKERTPAVFARDVEAEWEHLQRRTRRRCPDEEIERLARILRCRRRTQRCPATIVGYRAALADNRAFANWAQRNVHRAQGARLRDRHAVAQEDRRPAGRRDVGPDGRDRRSRRPLQLRRAARLARAEPDLRRRAAARPASRCGASSRRSGFATPNIGLLTNIVCCPGGDFCSLANAKSIPIAEAIQRRFDDLDYLHDIGELDLNISGCMNACGHHHVGHIGILGVDKNGAEWYQVSIGGAQGNDAALGKVIGPSFAARRDARRRSSRLIETYVEHRHEDERFVDTVRRLGIEPFKERVYAAAH